MSPLRQLLILITTLSWYFTTTSGCTYQDIRLYGGSTTSGMVQMCNASGGWEAVCDYYWNCDESMVACHQLGYPGAKSYRVDSGSWSSIGFGPYSSCSYYYTSLFQCSSYSSYYLNSNTYCRTNRDTVTITCNSPSPDNCTNGDVRLVDGETNNEGRIEYCYYGEWSILCSNNNIYRQTASNICYKLGYRLNSYASVFNDGRFNKIEFSMMTYIESINCGTGVDPLSECRIESDISYSGTCLRRVRCIQPYNPYDIRCYEHIGCTEGAIRLADGKIDHEGRVEVCSNGVWGSICDTYFDVIDGDVICSQLGYKRLQFIYHNSHFGDGYGPIIYSNVHCVGDEDRFSDCSKNNYLSTTCDRSDVVGILCKDDCEEGAVRVVGGDGKSYGTVEVCIGGIWGLITDNSWDDKDSVVICRQLGFEANSDNSHAVHNSYYGKPHNVVYMNDVECTGDEAQILNCDHVLYDFDTGKNKLDNASVAGVNCPVTISTSQLKSSASPLTSTATPPATVSDNRAISSESTLTITSILLIILIIGIFIIAIIMIVILLVRRKRGGHNNGTTEAPREDLTKHPLAATNDYSKNTVTYHNKEEEQEAYECIHVN